jgi:hypothetical protein
VIWQAPEAPVDKPVALFVDVPGGPMDRLAADPDVATFLNDRFHPVFLTSSDAQPTGTVAFYAPGGCPLTPPASPADAPAWIALANEVIQRDEARSGHADRLQLRCAIP